MRWSRLVVWMVVGVVLVGCGDDEADRDRPRGNGGNGGNGGAGRQVDLDGLPASLRQLVTELRRGNRADRRAAIEALGELEAQAIPVLPELRGYLDAEDARTRIAAAKAVARIEQARREQPILLTDITAEYTTRPQQGKERPISGIWKTKVRDSVVSPYRTHPPDEGVRAAEGFLAGTKVIINRAGQAQFTLSIPTQFRQDFEGRDEINVLGRCNVNERGVLLEAHRALGLAQSIGVTGIVERSEPTLDGERRANLLLTVKLTFVGAKDILEAGAFLEMVRQ